MYETGGEITGFGWICLIALGYLLGVFFLQRAFPSFDLSGVNVINTIVTIFIFGLWFLVFRKIIRYFRNKSRKPTPKR